MVRFSIRFLNGCDAGNYANISPLMDVLFGTYCCPDGEPESFGVQEAMPRGYVGQIAFPFWPNRQTPGITLPSASNGDRRVESSLDAAEFSSINS